MKSTLLSELKRHPPGLLVLFFSTLVNRMGTMVLPFLMLYLTSARHISPERAATMIGAYGVGGFLMNLVGGSLGDLFGAVRILILSLVGSALLLCAIPHVHSEELLFLTIVIWSLFSEASRATSFAAIGQYSHPDLQKSAYALARVAINLGMSIGPVVGGLLAATHFSWLFYLDGITSLFAAGLLIRFLPPGPVPPHQGLGDLALRLSTGWWRALSDRRLLLLNAVIFPLSLIYAQLDSTFPLFVVKQMGISEKVYGFIYCINTVLVCLIEVPLNLRIEGVSVTPLVRLGALSLAVGVMLFSHGTLPVLICGMIVFTIGEMLIFPTTSALISQISPAAYRSAYMGIAFASWGLCNIAGPVVGTWVLTTFGSNALWFGAAALSVVAITAAPRLKRLTVSASDADG